METIIYSGTAFIDTFLISIFMSLIIVLPDLIIKINVLRENSRYPSMSRIGSCLLSLF